MCSRSEIPAKLFGNCDFLQTAQSLFFYVNPRFLIAFPEYVGHIIADCQMLITFFAKGTT